MTIQDEFQRYKWVRSLMYGQRAMRAELTTRQAAEAFRLFHPKGMRYQIICLFFRIEKREQELRQGDDLPIAITLEQYLELRAKCSPDADNAKKTGSAPEALGTQDGSEVGVGLSTKLASLEASGKQGGTEVRSSSFSKSKKEKDTSADAESPTDRKDEVDGLPAFFSQSELGHDPTPQSPPPRRNRSQERATTKRLAKPKAPPSARDLAGWAILEALVGRVKPYLVGSMTVKQWRDRNAEPAKCWAEAGGTPQSAIEAWDRQSAKGNRQIVVAWLQEANARDIARSMPALSTNSELAGLDFEPRWSTETGRPVKKFHGMACPGSSNRAPDGYPPDKVADWELRGIDRGDWPPYDAENYRAVFSGLRSVA